MPMQNAELQKELVTAQTEYYNALRERFNSSDKALVEIDAKGVEPAVEAVLRTILDKAQVWMTQADQAALFGLTL